MKSSNKWIVAGVVLILLGSFCIAYEVVNRFTGEAFTVKDITADGSGKAVKTILFEQWEHCKAFWMWSGLALITFGSICQIICACLDKSSPAESIVISPMVAKTSIQEHENLFLTPLYDIRVKEMHHYNTVVWAFPLAYAVLLVSEIRFIDAGSWLLVCAAIFNFTLYYVFWHHLENMNRIRIALKFTEGKLANQYGSKYMDGRKCFPDFPESDPRFPPKATAVMMWSIIVVTFLFLFRAVYTKFSC